MSIDPPKPDPVVGERAGVAERDADPRRRLVRQVLESRTFAKSARLSQFFEFICTRTLDGHAEEINEQQIGVHVFGRSPSYNATDDSVVRSQARLLRQRLEEYFEHECPACPTIILVPKGGYVPVFEQRSQEMGLPIAPPHSTSPAVHPLPPASAPKQPRAEHRRYGWVVVAAAVVLLVAGIGVWLAMLHRPIPTASALLWRSVFEADRPVVIVPSDDGLVLSEEARHAPVTLDEYLSGDYLRNTPGLGARAAGDESLSPEGVGASSSELTSDWLSSHQYTSTADLDLALRLSRLPEAARAYLQPRYARVLRLDDLKTNNVILIGGIGANPWVGLYAPELNFDVNYDFRAHEGYVINKHPQPGEPAKYLESHTDGSVSNYGVLAYLPGITGVGSALLFEGSGMAGTEAAADFPFNTTAFEQFAERLGRTSGGGLPYFEVLLETRSLNGNASEARILAWRVVHS
jgi:hypothetical protein